MQSLTAAQSVASASPRCARRAACARSAAAASLSRPALVRCSQRMHAQLRSVLLRACSSAWRCATERRGFAHASTDGATPHAPQLQRLPLGAAAARCRRPGFSRRGVSPLAAGASRLPCRAQLRNRRSLLTRLLARSRRRQAGLGRGVEGLQEGARRTARPPRRCAHGSAPRGPSLRSASRARLRRNLPISRAAGIAHADLAFCVFLRLCAAFEVRPRAVRGPASDAPGLGRPSARRHPAHGAQRAGGVDEPHLRQGGYPGRGPHALRFHRRRWPAAVRRPLHAAVVRMRDAGRTRVFGTRRKCCNVVSLRCVCLHLSSLTSARVLCFAYVAQLRAPAPPEVQPATTVLPHAPRLCALRA